MTFDPREIQARKRQTANRGFGSEGYFYKKMGLPSQIQRNAATAPVDPNPRPVRPDVTKTFGGDAETGFTMGKGLSYTPQLAQQDMSPWLSLQQQQNQQQLQSGLGNLAAQNQGAMAQARSGLAMRGGLRGGAAERLANLGAERSTMGAQDLRSQAAARDLEAQVQAERMGREAERFNVGQQNLGQKYNMDTLLNQIGAYDQAQQNIYGQEMAGWAAEKTAKAMKPKKRGGIFGALFG